LLTPSADAPYDRALQILLAALAGMQAKKSSTATGTAGLAESFTMKLEHGQIESVKKDFTSP
jgi:hypothetical protein